MKPVNIRITEPSSEAREFAALTKRARVGCFAEQACEIAGSQLRIPDRLHIRCRITILLAAALVAQTVPANAQVHEQWRAVLTNGVEGAHQKTATVMDGLGNVIVGGLLRPANSGSSGGVFLAKFNAEGEKLWKYSTAPESFSGVDALAVDAGNNIYASARISGSEPWHLALIKLDPLGTELWRILEPDGSQAGATSTGSSVAIDATGHSYLLGIREITTAEGLVTEVFVSKHDPNGQSLWRCSLPDAFYGLALGGLRNCLAVSSNEAVAVGGLEAHPTLGRIGFVAAINADGSLRWFRNTLHDAGIVGPVSSVAFGNGNMRGGRRGFCNPFPGWTGARVGRAIRVRYGDGRAS